MKLEISNAKLDVCLELRKTSGGRHRLKVISILVIAKIMRVDEIGK